MKAFATASAAFNKESIEAFSAVSTTPAASIAAIDLLLAQIPSLQETQLALIQDTGAWGITTPENCRLHWRQQRTMMFNFRWAAAHRAGLTEERARTSAMAHNEFEDAPNDPYWAMIDEQDAELAADTPTREQLLDRAFDRRLAAGAYLEAARNRMRAAALAGEAARFDRQRTCASQGIDVAEQYALRREQVAFSISRYSMLLIGDQSGATLEELRGQLDFVTKPQGALPDLLERVYGEGTAQLANPSSQAQAAAMADSFGLMGEANNITEAQDPATLASACMNATAALKIQRDSQYLDLLLLSSQFKSLRGDSDTPLETILPAALALAVTPEDLCRVQSAFADAWEYKKKLLRAIASASDAFEAVRIPGPATTRAQAEARLNTLRSQLGGAEEALKQDPALDADDYVTRRAQAALSALSAQDAAGAVSTLDEILPIARAQTKKAEVLLMRGVALWELARLSDAGQDLASAASIFAAAFDADSSLDGNLLAQRETAYLLLAFVHARLGNASESWMYAETARSYVLRRKLQLTDFTWDSISAALHRRKAALLDICVLRWGTLVITASPEEEKPVVSMCPSFRASDVARLLERPGLGDDSDKWTEVLMGAVPELSQSLMSLLAERLSAISKAAEILYVVTDGPLAHAPLAALEWSPGNTLADLIPFSVLPFASLLLVEDTRRKADVHPSTVALAFGKDSQQFDFKEHLETLAEVLSAFSAVIYSDLAATARNFQEAASSSDILYLSSHGTLNHLIADLERASSLILADSVVSSYDVAHWPSAHGIGDPTLTLLNACQSGRFRALTRSEMGGFPAAFLVLGRRTLIAPVTHVDPLAAVSLADVLLRRLKQGVPAARALQAARLSLKNSGAPISSWAAHHMFGLDMDLQ
jgi:hypothetical protein